MGVLSVLEFLSIFEKKNEAPLRGPSQGGTAHCLILSVHFFSKAALWPLMKLIVCTDRGWLSQFGLRGLFWFGKETVDLSFQLIKMYATRAQTIVAKRPHKYGRWWWPPKDWIVTAAPSPPLLSLSRPCWNVLLIGLLLISSQPGVWLKRPLGNCVRTNSLQELCVFTFFCALGPKTAACLLMSQKEENTCVAPSVWLWVVLAGWHGFPSGIQSHLKRGQTGHTGAQQPVETIWALP